MAEDISNLKDKGKKVIIVSSGAVALGKKIFHLDSEKLDLEPVSYTHLTLPTNREV